jgi:hypothetical protein
VVSHRLLTVAMVSAIWSISSHAALLFAPFSQVVRRFLRCHKWLITFVHLLLISTAVKALVLYHRDASLPTICRGSALSSRGPLSGT